MHCMVLLVMKCTPWVSLAYGTTHFLCSSLARAPGWHHLCVLYWAASETCSTTTERETPEKKTTPKPPTAGESAQRPRSRFAYQPQWFLGGGVCEHTQSRPCCSDWSDQRSSRQSLLCASEEPEEICSAKERTCEWYFGLYTMFLLICEDTLCLVALKCVDL